MGIANSWVEAITMGICNFIGLWFGQKYFNLALVVIFIFCISNRQRLRADGILFHNHRQYLFVVVVFNIS